MEAFRKIKTAGVKGTFLDDQENPVFEEADVCVLGVAFDATASYKKGAFFGPSAIMDASHEIEHEIPVFGVSLAEKVKIHWLGLLEYEEEKQEKKDFEKRDALAGQMVSDVEEIASKAFEKHKFLVTLGGEHSVSNGIFNAIAKKFNAKKVTIVHIDAHLDLRDSFEGMKYSHGSVMKNALDAGFRIISLGIRDQVSFEEIETIKEKGIAGRIFPCPVMPSAFYTKKGVFEKNQFLWKGIISAKIAKKIFSSIKTPFVYLTIDVDGFDPMFFPGTGTPLPFGLDFASGQEFLFSLMQFCKKSKKQLLGFDVQETAPQLQKNAEKYSHEDAVSTQTEMNAAILIYNLIAWNFLERFSGKNKKRQ